MSNIIERSVSFLRGFKKREFRHSYIEEKTTIRGRRIIYPRGYLADTIKKIVIYSANPLKIEFKVPIEIETGRLSLLKRVSEESTGTGTFTLIENPLNPIKERHPLNAQAKFTLFTKFPRHSLISYYDWFNLKGVLDLEKITGRSLPAISLPLSVFTSIEWISAHETEKFYAHLNPHPILRLITAKCLPRCINDVFEMAGIYDRLPKIYHILFPIP